jgi:hypothetical protein
MLSTCSNSQPIRLIKPTMEWRNNISEDTQDLQQFIRWQLIDFHSSFTFRSDSTQRTRTFFAKESNMKGFKVAEFGWQLLHRKIFTRKFLTKKLYWINNHGRKIPTTTLFIKHFSMPGRARYNTEKVIDNLVPKWFHQ